MECRRCGEDNLPGVPVCLGCGVALGEEVALVATVPQVAAKNPLERRQKPRPAPFQRQVAAAAGMRPVVAAALVGAIPGLSPARRGERREAVLRLGAVLVAVGLVALTWTSEHHVLALIALQAAWSWGPVAEARRAMPSGEPARTLGAVLLAFSMLVLLRLGVGLSLDALVDRIIVAPARNLPGGVYLVEPLDGMPELGTLVAWRVGRVGGVRVAPVVALPGQQVSMPSGKLLVDGEPTPIPQLNPGYLPRLPSFLVPEGEVAVWSSPLETLALDEIEGRLWYRWWPPEERGRVERR